MSKFQPIFDRSKEALSIIGITSTHQSAQELRDFLKYEGCQHMLEGFGEYVASIEGICGKIEGYEAERQRKARISQHVGKRGERQDFTARITFTKTFPPKEEGMNESTLTVLADDEGNVLKYWNHVNIAEPTEENPKQKRPGVKNERVTFAAMVVEHGEYKGIKETVLQRVTKGKLA